MVGFWSMEIESNVLVFDLRDVSHDFDNSGSTYKVWRYYSKSKVFIGQGSDWLLIYELMLIPSTEPWFLVWPWANVESSLRLAIISKVLFSNSTYGSFLRTRDSQKEREREREETNAWFGRVSRCVAHYRKSDFIDVTRSFIRRWIRDFYLHSKVNLSLSHPKK